ncbi:glycoside hydrolase family 28 protein [Aurantibacter sp.]|uniref:glycoside hydrolase family 28 protein n=1 Tax=Aurantibacter sp. TaxID=2807103 RepID=UPI003263E2CB
MSIKNTRTFLTFTLLILSIICNIYAQDSFYNVKEYGATGDGQALESSFIQKAIDACSENGGGTVYLPAGVYRSGTIVLKSNIRLYLEARAKILGSSDRNDYQVITPDFPSRTNDLYVNRSVIYAENAENISIEGKGVIDGNGLIPVFNIKRPQIHRPYLVRFINCKNLTIRDVRLVEAANWTLHLLGCKQVVVDGLKIFASHRENRDGIDIDGCQDVAISNCDIVSGDDAIVLKSTGPAICKNIMVTNCKLTSQASAFKMGTESTGGFENITFSNSIITNVKEHTAIAMMMVDGGTLRNVTINNIVMDSVSVPFFIRLGDRARPYKKGLPPASTGSVENINISNVIVTNSGLSSHVTGLHKKKIKNISFSNITIVDNQAYKGIPLPYNEVPFKESHYPMGQMYGSNLPSSTFYFRNIEGLKLDNINIKHSQRDNRPSIVLDRITNMKIKGVSADTQNKAPLAYLRNIEKGAIFESSNYGVSNYLTHIEHSNCKNVSLKSDLMFEDQRASKQVDGLPDRIFEDIKGKSFKDFNQTTSLGLPSYPLKEGKQSFSLEKTVNFPFKLMVLNYSNGSPETLQFKIKNNTYSLQITNKSWGWNAVTVEEIFKGDKKVIIEMLPVNGSSVFVSKIVLVPTKVTD